MGKLFSKILLYFKTLVRRKKKYEIKEAFKAHLKYRYISSKYVKNNMYQFRNRCVLLCRNTCFAF